MTDPTDNSDDILRKLSRRNLLRNSVITATGVALLPSFLTGCTKDDKDLVPAPGPNLGGELAEADLAQAAANLTTLRQLITEVYDLSAQYDEAVFHALASTKQNSSWTNFIVDLFIDIALAICAAAALITANPEIMPSIALIGAVLKDWAFGKDKPNGLDGVFADFEFGHNKMQFELQQKLSSLIDSSNNYSNLRSAWTDKISFNGKDYTLGDLASTKFELGDAYNKLQAAMFTSLKQSIWNLAIMKCCSYHKFETFSKDVREDGCNSASEYARKIWYKDPDHKGHYLRGIEYSLSEPIFTFAYWSLGINGYSFPDDASNQLFIDSVPGNVINPDGLFNRSYVFQQFSTFKPDFEGYHEIASISNGFDGNFAASDDYDFTGGAFPKLTH